MGLLGAVVTTPKIDTGKFGVLFAAEDNTTGAAFTTSDASGYAHVDYGRVDVGLTLGTIGGTVYPATPLNNNQCLVAPAQRILNQFPNDSLVSISIRRGRTRVDQYDDVGECTIQVLNTSGDSDPDNNAGRYQRLTTGLSFITNITNSGGTITYTAANNFVAGDLVQITGVNPDVYNYSDAAVVSPNATSFKVVRAGTATYVSGGTATVNSVGGTAVKGSFIRPGMYGQVVWGGAAGEQIPLFTGMIETVEPTDDRVSTATYTFVDRMAQLGRTTTVNGTKVGANGDTGGQRLQQIVQIARLIDQYNGNGGTNPIETVINIPNANPLKSLGFERRVQLNSLGDTAMDCLKTIVNGEAGRIFVSRSGVVNIWDRAYMQTQGTVMAGTFTDTPGSVAGFGYDEIQTNQAQNFLYNSALVTVGSAVTASTKNDASISVYGERRYEVECALLNSTGDGLALATFLATEWSTPSKNVASISVQTFGMSQANFDTIAKIDLQQGVRVYRRLPGNRVLDVNCVVEGIEIDIDPSNRRFTFYLSPRDTATINWPS